MDRIERRLGGIVQGAFGRVFKSDEVSTVEVASALQQACDDNQADAGDGNVLVPNDFTVRLGTRDFTRLQPYEAPLVREFESMIGEHAEEFHYTTAGPIHVRLEHDENLDTGVFSISSAADNRPDLADAVAARAKRAGTPAPPPQSPVQQVGPDPIPDRNRQPIPPGPIGEPPLVEADDESLAGRPLLTPTRPVPGPGQPVATNPPALPGLPDSPGVYTDEVASDYPGYPDEGESSPLDDLIGEPPVEPYAPQVPQPATGRRQPPPVLSFDDLAPADPDEEPLESSYPPGRTDFFDDDSGAAPLPSVPPPLPTRTPQMTGRVTPPVTSTPPRPPLATPNVAPQFPPGFGADEPEADEYDQRLDQPDVSPYQSADQPPYQELAPEPIQTWATPPRPAPEPLPSTVAGRRAIPGTHRLVLTKGTSAMRGVAARGGSLNFAISYSPVILGRHESADIRLDDPGISRQHAQITIDEDGYARIDDLDSTNGTMVNDQRIRAAWLSDGDRIHLGTTTLIYRTGTAG